MTKTRSLIGETAGDPHGNWLSSQFAAGAAGRESHTVLPIHGKIR